MDFALQTMVDGILLAAGPILIAAGLALLFGVANYVNIAQGDLAMMSMYAAFFLWAFLGVDPFISALAIAPAMFVLGLVFHRVMVQPVLTREHSTHIIMTLGLALVLQNLALLLWTANVRNVQLAYDRALAIGPVSVNLARLMAFSVAMAIMLVLGVFLLRTRFGRAIRAVSQDDSLASAFGVPVGRVLAITSGIAVALAGVGGSLMMAYFPVYPEVGIRFLLIAFTIVILGGMGSVKGAVLAGILLGIVEATGQFYFGGQMGRILLFSSILVVLYVKPSGLFGKAVI